MYIDANIFILASLSPDEKGDKARRILKGAEHGVASSLCLDEVMWVVLRNRRKELLRQIIEDIYSMENVKITDTPAGIPLRAVDLIEEFNLKPRDAFHVAMMESLGETSIASDDKDFDRVPQVKRVAL